MLARGQRRIDSTIQDIGIENATFQILIEVLFEFTDNSTRINKSVNLIGRETYYTGWITKETEVNENQASIYNKILLILDFFNN